MNEFGFEGIVAKRKDSCYEIGKRSGGWLKYKVNKAQDTPDNPLDALIIGYNGGDKLIFVSKVCNRRDQKLCLAQTAACGADRVHGVDS